MKLYQLSSKHEINILENISIIYSQDFSQMYHADTLETYIITFFNTPTSIEAVEEKISKIPNFNRNEFYEYITDLIEKQIIEECNE